MTPMQVNRTTDTNQARQLHVCSSCDAAEAAYSKKCCQGSRPAGIGFDATHERGSVRPTAVAPSLLDDTRLPCCLLASITKKNRSEQRTQPGLQAPPCSNDSRLEPEWQSRNIPHTRSYIAQLWVRVKVLQIHLELPPCSSQALSAAPAQTASVWRRFRCLEFEMCLVKARGGG